MGGMGKSRVALAGEVVFNHGYDDLRAVLGIDNDRIEFVARKFEQYIDGRRVSVIMESILKDPELRFNEKIYLIYNLGKMSAINSCIDSLAQSHMQFTAVMVTMASLMKKPGDLIRG